MSALPAGLLVVVPGASFYDWLMFGHVLAAMVWVGGWAILSILAAQALHQGDHASLARFAATIRFIGPRLLAPATILVAVLGVWLLLDGHQWHISQFWIELAIGLLLAVFVIGAGFQSRAAIGAERAIAENKLDRAKRLVRQWERGSLLILLLLTVVTWDMIVKP